MSCHRRWRRSEVRQERVGVEGSGDLAHRFFRWSRIALGHARSRVAESFGDLLQTDIAISKPASKGVAKIVRTEGPPDARELLRGQERAANPALREPPALRIHEDVHARDTMLAERPQGLAECPRDRDLGFEPRLLHKHPNEPACEVHRRPLQVAQVRPRAQAGLHRDDEEVAELAMPLKVRTRGLAVAAHAATEAPLLATEARARLHRPERAAGVDVTAEGPFIFEGGEEARALVGLQL